MINLSDMRKKSKVELEKEILVLRKSQFDLRMQKGSGESIKTDNFAKIRRNIARIKTILSENSEVSK